jgi:hypothetical protein
MKAFKLKGFYGLEQQLNSEYSSKGVILRHEGSAFASLYKPKLQQILRYHSG